MKIGVIGLGSMGTRHALNLKNLGHEVESYDPVRGHKPERLKDILDESEAIVIASPTPTHYEYIKQIGKPVFVEKPIGDGPMGISDNVLMVGYNLRFHSCVIAAKGWIDAGHLGAPLWANLVCAEKKKNPKNDVILNWSHEIDLALYLLGPAHLRAAVADPKETIADLTLWHGNGCQSTIHLDYLAEPPIRQTIIVGNKAKIILDLEHRRAWLQDASGTMLDQFQGQDNQEQNYADEIETFIARCNGTETIGCTGNEALEVLKICLAAQQLASNFQQNENSSKTCLPEKKNGQSSLIIRTA